MTEKQPSAGPLHSEFAGDPEMAELVEYFVEEAVSRVQGLRACWEEQRLEDLQRMAHQLKGASGGYGFPTISDAAAQLEQALKVPDPDLEGVRREMERLVDLCSRASL